MDISHVADLHHDLASTLLVVNKRSNPDHDLDDVGAKKKGRKKSQIWENVRVDDENRVVCRHCNQVIRVKYGEKVNQIFIFIYKYYCLISIFNLINFFRLSVFVVTLSSPVLTLHFQKTLRSMLNLLTLLLLHLSHVVVPLLLLLQRLMIVVLLSLLLRFTILLMKLITNSLQIKS